MSAPHYDRHGVTVHHGDCLDVLAGLDAESVDAVVTDPPYGLEFMGKGWDQQVPGPEYWAACLRVLKPGGHLLAFGGTRTAHRMACAIEDAGLEIRDSITWLYGSGFPKSLDVSKAIDATLVHGKSNSKGIKAANETRPGEGRTRTSTTNNGIMGDGQGAKITRDQSATDAARQWQGWGTALKPAQEPVVLARKPLAGTVAANVLAHGTGGINIDACRVHGPDALAGRTRHGGGSAHSSSMSGPLDPDVRPESPAGRWPSNVVLSHAQAPDGGDACADGCVEGCPVAELDAQSGTQRSSATGSAGGRGQGAATYAQDAYTLAMERTERPAYGDSGGASRYFPTFRWEPKTPTSERPMVGGVSHPTVKPLSLLIWLTKLLTPPRGTVLDPFAGTGTTLQAARANGFKAIGIEREPAYLPLIVARLDARGRTTATEAAPPVAGEPLDLLDLLDGEVAS